MLSVSELSAGYGEARIVHGVSIAVPDRSIVSIVGPNGAGKSTLVRCITGELVPTAGQITLDGKSLNDVPVYERCRQGVRTVPEGRELLRGLTVDENIMVGALDLDKPKRLERLAWVYETYPRLKERRRQRVETLSGGEQQMVALGRALVHPPKVLVLDEPSLGLAPRIVEAMLEIIGSLPDRLGSSVLLIEQNVGGALAISDYVYQMAEGKIVLEGSPDQLSQEMDLVRGYLGA